MQESSYPRLPLLGERDAKAGGVLLRRELHVRLGLPVPELVRLRDEGAVSRMTTAVRYAGERMSDVIHAELAPPSPDPRVLARELMEEREPVLAFLRRRLRSGADAEDLFQQALVRATEHASSLRDPSRLRAWFFRIVRRVLADHHAAWATREAKLATLAADVEESPPEEVAACACSLGQLEQIKPEYADMLRKVDLEEESLADVANALGITVNNATVRLHRARKALREQLVSFCGTASAHACADCACDG